MPRDSRLYMTFPIDLPRDPRLARLPAEVRWVWLEVLAYSLGRGTLQVEKGDLALFTEDPQAAERLVRAGLWQQSSTGWLIRGHELWGLRSRTRGKIPKALRNLVLERDRHRCVECGSTENLQIDHKFPLSLGGRDEPDNLQVLCAGCNQRKGASI